MSFSVYPLSADKVSEVIYGNLSIFMQIVFNNLLETIAKSTIVILELCNEISNNVVCATSKGSDQPTHTRSLIRAFVDLLNNL